MSAFRVPKDVFEAYVAPLLTQADFIQLRMCSKETLALVDSMLPLQLAFQIHRQQSIWNTAHHSRQEGVERAARYTLRCMVCSRQEQVDLFAYACTYLGMDFAKDVYERWHESMGRDLNGKVMEIFAEVCKYNQRDVALWMVETFALDLEQIKANDHLALRNAIVDGNLDLVKWLVERFGLAADCIRGRNIDALVFCGGKGHLETVRWVCEKFNLTRDDVVGNDSHMLRHACFMGKTDVVKFLIDKFSLNRQDVSAMDNYCLRVSVSSAWLEQVKFLMERFNYKATDATAGEPQLWEDLMSGRRKLGDKMIIAEHIELANYFKAQK